MNAPAVSFNVARRFHELRRRYLSVRISVAVAATLAALVTLWLVLSAVDYYWEWSLGLRKGFLLAGVVAIAAWFGHWLFSIVRDTRQRKFAAQLEQEFEEFGQRIRTVLDTVDGKVEGPDEMLTALGHQTLGRWETLSPNQMVPTRALLIGGAVCGLGLVIAGVSFLTGGDVRTAMKRALGQPIPYTQISVSPGHVKVLEGNQMHVSLQLTGRTERDVTLRYRHLPLAIDAKNAAEPDELVEEAEWIESELVPNELAEGEEANDREANFTTKLGKAKQPIEYQFVTSIGDTEVFRLDVQPLIEVERIETTVQPPAYTRLENRSFSSPSVTVLEHSTVSVTIQANHPLKEATLLTGKKASNLSPVDLEPGEDQTTWTFELPSTSSIHWKFAGNGHDGTPMAPVKGRLRVRYDSAPNLSWRDPPDEIKVHTLAELPMRVQVADDYGIVESGIVFQLGGDEEYELANWGNESESEDSITTRIRLEEILPLESLSLSERDYIAYYAYAIDNREFGPHRAESDVRYIDIRPLRQFYSEFEQDPMQGGGGRVIVQLDEIIRRQRFLVNRTRRLLKSSSNDLAKQLGTIDRMVESQSELAGLTRFLAEFFVSRGNDDVEALNQAETAMLQAADSLAAGSFDLALVQEEDALRALAEARRTLEILLLKNPTPQQQAALRRLARQLRQKLRRERPETEQQIADTLQRIASEQAQLGQSAARLAQRQSNNSGQGMGGQPSESNRNGQAGGGEPQSADANADESETEQTGENEGDPPAADDSQPSDDAQTNGAGTDSEDGESDPSEESETQADGDGEADEPSIEDQQQELFAQQVDLLERMQAIEEQLADRLSGSSLMAERMEEVKSSMDSLAASAREGDMDALAGNSRETADQIREISIQLDALSASEPVSRVSSIRDMAASLANMEQQLSQQLSQSDSTDKETLEKLAKGLQRRAETIEDVLKAPVDVGDVETSEVNDQLQQFVEENEFLDQLESSKDVRERIADESSQTQEGAQAHDRAIEYAMASRMLDELYQQLVTPRLNRLRQIEQQANQLASQMQGKGQSGSPSNNSNGGGNGEQEEMDEAEVKAGMRMLEEQLEEEGLTDLAELLSEAEVSDEEIEAQLDAQFGEIGSGGDGLGIERRLRAGRLALVAAELQARIQEMILLEISADRDAPVPAQYRRAVDGYFRSLAGEAEEKVMMETAGGAN